MFPLRVSMGGGYHRRVHRFLCLACALWVWVGCPAVPASAQAVLSPPASSPQPAFAPGQALLVPAPGPALTTPPSTLALTVQPSADHAKPPPQPTMGETSPSAATKGDPGQPGTPPGESAPKPSPPPAPPPLPALPPGSGMGGFPGPPEAIKDPESLNSVGELFRKHLTVRLRDGGTLRPYGFFRGDLDLATARFNDIQNPFFVLSPDARFSFGPNNVPVSGQDFNYSLYPRLTRFGLEYYGKQVEYLCNGVPSGRLEVDFLTNNPAGPESRELLRLRLAYGQVTWGEWTLLVGQDWDVIAPLVPTIDDNTVLWNAGNLGDRRPQIRLMWDHDLGQGYRVQFQNALALADAVNGIDRDGNGVRDNEDFGMPAYEGRLGLVAPSAVCGQSILAGVWGVYGLDLTGVPVAGRRRFPIEGVGVDLRLPLSECLTFQTEWWWGRNLDDFRGGIGQGFDLLTAQLVESVGGWAELVFRPLPWYQGSLGFAIDNPNDGTVGQGGRTLNSVWYVGNRFPVGSGVTLGADVENWTTEYRGLNRGKATRIKFFMALAF